MSVNVPVPCAICNAPGVGEPMYTPGESIVPPYHPAVIGDTPLDPMTGAALDPWDIGDMYICATCFAAHVHMRPGWDDPGREPEMPPGTLIVYVQRTPPTPNPGEMT